MVLFEEEKLTVIIASILNEKHNDRKNEGEYFRMSEYDLNILSNKILLSSSSDVISSAILNPFKNHSEFLLLSSEYFNKFNYYAYL